MATADCRFLRRPARKPVRSQHHRAKRRPGGRLDLQRRAVRRDDHRNVRGARPCRGCARCRRCHRGMAFPAALRLRFRAGRRLLRLSGSRNDDGRMHRKHCGLASRGLRAVDHGGVASLGAILVNRATDGAGPCLHARRIRLGAAGGWCRIADPRDCRRPGDRHVRLRPADQPRRLGCQGTERRCSSRRRRNRVVGGAGGSARRGTPLTRCESCHRVPRSLSPPCSGPES